MLKESELIGWNQFYQLLRLFNSKIYRLDRKEFCQIIGLSVNNYNGYIGVFNLLVENKILKVLEGNENQSKIYFINKKTLERFIRHTDNFKSVENFIHKSTFFAETGVSP